MAARLQATLQSLENAQLNIGITGVPGSGKSTLVNALRGLGDEEANSAATGVVEMKTGPTAYLHPKYPNVVIWDLPGIGPTILQVHRSLQQLLRQPYDLLLILSAGRFPNSLAQLACRLDQQGAHFCLIRSKVDVDVAAACSRRPSTFSEEAVLCQIRDDCAKQLEGEARARGRAGVRRIWGPQGSLGKGRDPKSKHEDSMVITELAFLRDQGPVNCSFLWGGGGGLKGMILRQCSGRPRGHFWGYSFHRACWAAASLMIGICNRVTKAMPDCALKSNPEPHAIFPSPAIICLNGKV